MFEIITRAWRHIRTLYAYITPLQHNRISNFFYEIQPIHKLVIFASFQNEVEICLLSFLRSFINKFIYDILAFLSILSAYALSFHCVIQLSDVWWISVRFIVKNECQRKWAFLKVKKCIINKNLRKWGLKITLNIL